MLVFLAFLLVSSPLSVFSSSSDQWHSKSKCTQKEFANHMDISCSANEFILIGWSHYGTKKTGRNQSAFKQQQRCEPSASDCIMDYTHKIAELCNGVSKCEVILTQQFIHKCSDEATYLFISYQCIDNSSIVDVCSSRSLSSINGLHLISPSFPNEYPNNVNCSCSVASSTDSTSPVMIDVESLSFNLQDNDYLSSTRSLPLSGTHPFGISLMTERNALQLTLTTDETLSQSGFWIRLFGYQPCQDDEYTLGSKCLKIFAKKQTWNAAQEKCLSLGARLIHLDDIVQEKKLAHFLTNLNDPQQTTFWISDDKEKSNLHSWWPWRASTEEGKCVLRTQDGWLKRPCSELQAFICERDINRQSIPLTVRCGNAPALVLSTTRPTVPLIQPPTATADNIRDSPAVPSIEPMILSSTDRQEQQFTTVTSESNKSTSIDPNILAAVLGGIAMTIFFVNILVCYVCKRRSSKQSKCKTPIESQSSFTHEELQRSLMQHLYHEQTNTISSTSTSSSKHSQSKSNDTSTTTAAGANVNLLQLCSPSSSSPPYMARSNVAAATALCFRNPHAGPSCHGDAIDYHVYETIPSESTSYSLCATHSAFKPILQSNSHTFRPFLPRTNILYHPPGPSKQSSYESTGTSTVLLPPCCHHHHHLQCSPGMTTTLRQHLSPRLITARPSSQEQIYVGSESIV